jgi:hypothetical protein
MVELVGMTAEQVTHSRKGGRTLRTPFGIQHLGHLLQRQIRLSAVLDDVELIAFESQLFHDYLSSLETKKPPVVNRAAGRKKARSWRAVVVVESVTRC